MKWYTSNMKTLAVTALHLIIAIPVMADGPTDNKLENPIRYGDFETFIIGVIEVLLVFLLPIVVIYIIYAGFLFVTAQGNETQLSKAKNALLYGLIGGAIVVGALAIVEIIKDTIAPFTI